MTLSQLTTHLSAFNQENKRVFGEVFTPSELIEEMLATLPEEVWRNPNLRWLDPAAGVGNFFALVHSRLMEGLASVIPDEDRRYRHILERMLYFVEIQEGSAATIHQIFGKGKYRLNVFQGDFSDFSEETFGIRHFDIVLGNPPYQHMHTDVRRKAKNHNLWSFFIQKGFDYLADGGFLLYVTPPAWMSPSSHLLNDIFLRHQLRVVNINECSRHFPGVGSKFSYYLIEKCPIYSETKFIFDFKGGSSIKPLRGFSTYTLNPNIRFIPQLPVAEAFNILEKTVFSQLPKYDVRYDSDLHRFTKQQLLAEHEDEQFPFKVIHTPSQTFWSSRPHKTFGKTKLLIPLTTYYEHMLIDSAGVTQGMGYVLCADRKEAEKIRKILLSDLYRFIANITRWSNFNVPLVMQNLPMYNGDPVNIGEYFNLNKDEHRILEMVKTVDRANKSSHRTGEGDVTFEYTKINPPVLGGRKT